MFFNRYVIDTHYGGLAFEDEGARCARLFDDPRKKVMIMGNHGVMIIGDNLGIVRYAGGEGRSLRLDVHEVMDPSLARLAGAGLRPRWEAVRRRHNKAADEAATAGCREAARRAAAGELSEATIAGPWALLGSGAA